MFWFDFFGYVAIIFSVISFLARTTFKMRVFGLFSSSFFAFSIYGYGGLNGAFVSLISFLIKALSLKFNEDSLKPIIFSSPIISLIFYFFFNEEGLIGILPATSLIFIITATLQKDILKMKYIYFGSAACWFVYAIIAGSIPAILFDVFNVVALSYSIYKIKQQRNIKDIF